MSYNIKIITSVSNNNKQYELFEFIKTVFCCDGKCEIEVKNNNIYLEHNGYTSSQIKNIGFTILESKYKEIIIDLFIESEFGEIFES